MTCILLLTLVHTAPLHGGILQLVRFMKLGILTVGMNVEAHMALL